MNKWGLKGLVPSTRDLVTDRADRARKVCTATRTEYGLVNDCETHGLRLLILFHNVCCLMNKE